MQSNLQLIIIYVIEVNHGVEKLVFINLLNKLNKFVNTKIYISEVDTDTFRYYK